MKPETEERMALAFERLADNQPQLEIGYAHPKFQQRLRDEGYFDEFVRPVYQNGYECPAQGLSKALIAKTSALRPGRYLGGQVSVSHDTRGGIHLSYKNGTADDRMRNLTLFSSFEDLVNKITAESAPAVMSA
jgi:hypothetical protein